MSYSEERRETTCGACGAVSHVIIAYSGDSRANERETTSCYKCGEQVDGEKCFAIFAAASAAEGRLRTMQSRR